MNHIDNKHPYLLFYLNNEGKYEVMSFRYTSDLPEEYFNSSTYVYSKQAQNFTIPTISWFKYEPQSKDYHNDRFTVINPEDVPNELKAMVLLLGFK